MDHAALFEQGDKGQEQDALEPVFVERVGRAVGGGDEHEPALVPEAGEEPREDDGVGDVVDEELIEAEDGRRGRGGSG